MKKSAKVYNQIPSSVELFGRRVETVDDTPRLNLLKNFGEARHGINQIAMSGVVNDRQVASDELKLTYLHEMLHFILSFTGYDPIIRESNIDIEQFIELLASGIFQYEKSAEYNKIKIAG
jgi:hypothetical protein